MTGRGSSRARRAVAHRVRAARCLGFRGRRWAGVASGSAPDSTCSHTRGVQCRYGPSRRSWGPNRVRHRRGGSTGLQPRAVELHADLVLCGQPAQDPLGLRGRVADARCPWLRAAARAKMSTRTRPGQRDPAQRRPLLRSSCAPRVLDPAMPVAALFILVVHDKAGQRILERFASWPAAAATRPRRRVCRMKKTNSDGKGESPLWTDENDLVQSRHPVRHASGPDAVVSRQVSPVLQVGFEGTGDDRATRGQPTHRARRLLQNSGWPRDHLEVVLDHQQKSNTR